MLKRASAQKPRGLSRRSRVKASPWNAAAWRRIVLDIWIKDQSGVRPPHSKAAHSSTEKIRARRHRVCLSISVSQ